MYLILVGIATEQQKVMQFLTDSSCLLQAGFFKRKEQDEMKAHRAQVASSNYGTVNDGMVGD